MGAIETLLAATAYMPPCGPNLEYDPQFTALESAAVGKPEQQLGDNVVPGEEPDWSAVRQQAEALLQQTKDVRVCIFLLRSWIKIHHLSGLRDGLTLLRGLLDQHWDSIHPVPDPNDPDDIVTRLNALAPLGAPPAGTMSDMGTVVVDVRNALVVVSGPHGAVSVRDILLAAGRMLPVKGDILLSAAQIEKVLATAAEHDRDGLRAAADSLAEINGIFALLTEKVGSAQATDLRPLSAMLKLVAQTCDKALQGAGGSTSAGTEDARGDVMTIAGDSGGASPTNIRTREDALHVLDQVCKFFEATEPGNPVPLLIRRAQRLVNLPFVDVMKDLAPDSLAQIRNIAGLKEET